jgi:hypothetical protein
VDLVVVFADGSLPSSNLSVSCMPEALACARSGDNCKPVSAVIRASTRLAKRPISSAAGDEQRIGVQSLASSLQAAQGTVESRQART